MNIEYERIRKKLRNNTLTVVEWLEFTEMPLHEIPTWQLLTILHPIFYQMRDTVQKYLLNREQGMHHLNKSLEMSDDVIFRDMLLIGITYFKGLVAWNSKEMFKMFNECYQRGDIRAAAYLSSCYRNGWGVNKDAFVSMKILEIGAQVLDINCLLSLAFDAEDKRKASRLCILALTIIHDENNLRSLSRQFEKILTKIQKNNPTDVIPYGEWNPTREVSRWLSDDMRKEMLYFLMVHERNLKRQFELPKDITRLLLSYICTLPNCH